MNDTEIDELIRYLRYSNLDTNTKVADLIEKLRAENRRLRKYIDDYNDSRDSIHGD
jgi:SMC interacting uncharacterized protein involved in chromosome segregation